MKTKRVVIKIGSSIILKNNSVDLKPLENIIKQIASLKKKGLEIILVSSGAIVLGRKKISFQKKWPQNLAGKQALAALGQPELMNAYKKYFEKYKIPIAQVLLIKDDLVSKERYLNVKNTLFTLLKQGIIPIINENDTTATEEIKFGDNDLLGALIAKKIKTNLLILLSNVDGLYDQKGEIIKTVKKITPALKKLIFPSKEELTRGGMASKIKAAKITTQVGIPCLVANGKRKNILLEIFNHKKIGTLFIP